MTTSSRHFKDIDYSFCPKSYWEAVDPLHAILATVRGTERREMIRALWQAGRMDKLPDSCLEKLLSEKAVHSIGRIHPTFMGGEYLPDFKTKEVEIARVELKSTTADVISVRAAPKKCRIVYSIVDEYEFDFQVSPASSTKPLTLGELVGMMDKAVDGESLGTIYTSSNYDSCSPNIEQLDCLRSFTRVKSDFYPQLSLHYESVTDRWYKREKRKIEGSEAAQ